MNAIEKFARDYGQEEYGNAYGQNLESEFRSCVQSVIGDKGDVIDAWNDGGSEGYAEWHCSIKNVEGMAPDTEFMLTLVTDLEDGNSWLTCQYDTADCDVLGEADGHVGDFDPFPLIDKCLKQAGKSESKKNERGSTNIETYDGFDELLGYADAEYLLEDVVDVLSKYYTYEGEGDDIVFDEDQAKGDPEFTIKIEGGDERADFYSEDIFYVHLPNKEAAEELAKVLGGELNESKKPESCKDGKKESMERCDSCGAVMTEYDYDRYGGLCKRCRDNDEAKKSEALTKDTTVVGQIDNSSLKWIERTLGQIKKKFPDVEADSRGNTITIRGKLADVSAVCDAYPKGISHLHQDKGGDFLPNAAGDDLDYGEVDKVLSESKKSEGIGDRIKMGIDYNMFMRMCRTAAYLDEDEDYWDALWEYYSEMGEIEDALVFFDNLFQYTAWCDADEVYDEYLDDKFKDKSKSKEECIDAAIDDGDLQAYKHEKGNYLVIL